jgi:hypothetical protein
MTQPITAKDLKWLRDEIARTRELTYQGLLIHGDSIAVWVDRTEALINAIEGRKPHART